MFSTFKVVIVWFPDIDILNNMFGKYTNSVKLMIIGVTTFFGYKMWVTGIGEFYCVGNPVYFNYECAFRC